MEFAAVRAEIADPSFRQSDERLRDVPGSSLSRFVTRGEGE